MSATPVDIVALCVDLVAEDIDTVLACSLVSRGVRRTCLRYLFWTVRYYSNVQNPKTLDMICEEFARASHISLHVREFLVAPTFPEDFWGCTKRTTLTPCTLARLNTVFPCLSVLVLDGFTWTTCKKRHLCFTTPLLPSLDRLTISHVRCVGGIDILRLVGFFEHIGIVSIMDNLPLLAGIKPSLPSLSHLRPVDLAFDLSLDSFTSRSGASMGQRALRFTMWEVVQTTLAQADQLRRLHLVWSISHAQRVPAPDADFSVDLAKCPSLQVLALGVSSVATARSTIGHMVATMATMTHTVQEIHIIVDTFIDQRSSDCLLDPEIVWPVVWQELASHHHVRTVVVHFSNMLHSGARKLGKTHPWGYLSSFVYLAKQQLRRHGYGGAFKFLVCHGTRDCYRLHTGA